MVYNLSEILPTKSIKQVTNMLKARHDREPLTASMRKRPVEFLMSDDED